MASSQCLPLPALSVCHGQLSVLPWPALVCALASSRLCLGRLSVCAMASSQCLPRPALSACSGQLSFVPWPAFSVCHSQLSVSAFASSQCLPRPAPQHMLWFRQGCCWRAGSDGSEFMGGGGRLALGLPGQRCWQAGLCVRHLTCACARCAAGGGEQDAAVLEQGPARVQPSLCLLSARILPLSRLLSTRVQPSPCLLYAKCTHLHLQICTSLGCSRGRLWHMRMPLSAAQSQQCFSCGGGPMWEVLFGVQRMHRHTCIHAWQVHAHAQFSACTHACLPTHIIFCARTSCTCAGARLPPREILLLLVVAACDPYDAVSKWVGWWRQQCVVCT